jgi:hypothetical protein
MQCPFCQNEMGNAQTSCPSCGRPHSPYVAYYIMQGWNHLQRGEEVEARTAFTEALKVTPPNDKQHLQAYVGYLVQQAAASRSGAARSMAPAPVAAVGSVAPAQSPSPPQPQAGAPAQSATVSAPLPHVQPGTPPAGEAKRGLFLNFSERPINIVRVMDEAKRQQIEYTRARGQRIWIVPLLLLAGLPFIYLDAIIGYNFLTFSLVALILWGAAIVIFIRFMRDRSLEFKTDLDRRPSRPGAACTTVFMIVFFGIWAIGIGGVVVTLTAAISPALVATVVVLIAALVSIILLKRSQPSGKQFGPKFELARTVFETIKDDLSPKRTLIGWLDLTGAQPGKIARQGTGSSGMPVHYYRDEWLKMKMVLYDGNVMRVSALERIKARMGRWKRKGRWKPGSSVSRNEIRVAITVNRQAYDALPLQAGQYGQFVINARESGSERIVLDALTDSALRVEDMLWVLRFAYAHLKPRGAPAATGG